MTITIDPILDAEIQAFQARKADAIEHTEVCLQVAYSLRQDGISTVAIHGRDRIEHSRIEIGEADFRRFFAGKDATEHLGVFTTLETKHSGVTVFCYIPTVAAKKQEIRTVQL